jgi:transposase
LLGSAVDLLNRLLQAPQGELRIQSFQHGDVAALKAAADRLEVISIIDRHVPASARELSVGTTLLLAALNRAIRPRSKRGWSNWAALTSLHRLFPGLKVEQLTSQFFWDQMDCVPLPALRAIEDELSTVIVKQLGIKLDALFYDVTNFFTFIASTNYKPQLPQRGHSKQKRTDLRLFSLALLVSREGHIPLCSHLFEGNRVDARSFPDSLTLIRERLQKVSVDLEEVTLVYDKGNLCRANQQLVDQPPFGYVASLVPTHHPQLLQIPLTEYQPLESARLGELPVLRPEREIWGKRRTVVLFISEQLRQGRIRGLMQHLKKALRARAVEESTRRAALCRGRESANPHAARGSTPEQSVEGRLRSHSRRHRSTALPDRRSRPDAVTNRTVRQAHPRHRSQRVVRRADPARLPRPERGRRSVLPTQG